MSAILDAALAVRKAGPAAFDAFLASLSDDVRQDVVDALARAEREAALVGVSRQASMLDESARHEWADAVVSLATDLATLMDGAVPVKDSGPDTWAGRVLRAIPTPYGTVKVTLTTRASKRA